MRGSGAWGIGHEGDEEEGQGAGEKLFPSAPLPLPHAPCPIPNALFGQSLSRLNLCL